MMAANLRARFTPSNIVDEMNPSDTTACIVGYVDRIEANLKRRDRKQYYKIVVNNDEGRTVQVTAWEANVSKLVEVQEGNSIVHVKNLRIKIQRNTSYNLENVSFELLFEKKSTVIILGSFALPSPSNNPMEFTELRDCHSKIGQLIRLRGYLKTAFNSFVHQMMTFYVGSMCDLDGNKVELKTTFESRALVRKGQCFEVTGVVESHPPGPLIVSINCREVIVVDSTYHGLH